jgi:dTDP-D-glucose 4,6-dehydratase
VVIIKAAAGELIPLYGDGANVRDWLYVADNVDDLLQAATRGEIGRRYCVVGKANAQTIRQWRQSATPSMTSWQLLIPQPPHRANHA